MDYRNKNRQLKSHNTVDFTQSLSNPDFQRKIDFYSHLKKDLNHYQNKLKIKPVKDCTITQKCFSKFIHNTLSEFISSHDELSSIKLLLSDDKIKKLILKALTKNIALENVE